MAGQEAYVKKPAFTLAILLTLIALVLLLSVRYGSETLSFADLHRALQPIERHYFVLVHYRLPRILLALLLRAALALSGVLVQGVIRNPLASPEIIGVNHAAGLMSIGALMLFPGMLVMWFTTAGLYWRTAGLFTVAAGRRQHRPLRLALLGVALTALYASITDYFMLSHPLEINEALMWLTGSLWGRGWAFVNFALPWLLLLLSLSLLLCRPLDLLALGEWQAATLGINVRHA